MPEPEEARLLGLLEQHEHLGNQKARNLLGLDQAAYDALKDVEAAIIGKSYEHLIRKFAEGGGQGAGEFYRPGEVGGVMAGVPECAPGMEVCDPCCGSGGLLIKCELSVGGSPHRLYGQECVAHTWAKANMNTIIRDMAATIEIGDAFKNPKFRERGRLKTFDRLVANPMLN